MAEYPHPLNEGRSANMRAIRRADTKPEIALRRALHRQGYRFRKDYRLDLADGKRVRPDIAFTARRVAVFVVGCFWHACPEHGGRPANNVWYWEPKLRRTVERDRSADAALDAAGWSVVRVWEHETLEAAVTAVLAALATAVPARARQPAPDMHPTPAAEVARETKGDKCAVPGAEVAQEPGRTSARCPASGVAAEPDGDAQQEPGVGVAGEPHGDVQQEPAEEHQAS